MNPKALTIQVVSPATILASKYDLVHDKGTFDVLYMRGEAQKYVEAMATHFVREGSIVAVTSCNTTQAELEGEFTKNRFTITTGGIIKSRSFELVSTLPHRAFQFAGVNGQVVSTIAFRTVDLPTTR